VRGGGGAGGSWTGPRELARKHERGLGGKGPAWADAQRWFVSGGPGPASPRPTPGPGNPGGTPAGRPAGLAKAHKTNFEQSSAGPGLGGTPSQAQTLSGRPRDAGTICGQAGGRLGIWKQAGGGTPHKPGPTLFFGPSRALSRRSYVFWGPNPKTWVESFHRNWARHQQAGRPGAEPRMHLRTGEEHLPLGKPELVDPTKKKKNRPGPDGRRGFSGPPNGAPRNVAARGGRQGTPVIRCGHSKPGHGARGGDPDGCDIEAPARYSGPPPKREKGRYSPVPTKGYEKPRTESQKNLPKGLSPKSRGGVSARAGSGRQWTGRRGGPQSHVGRWIERSGAGRPWFFQNAGQKFRRG